MVSVIIGNGNLGNSLYKVLSKIGETHLISKSNGFNIFRADCIRHLSFFGESRDIYYCVGSRGYSDEEEIEYIHHRFPFEIMTSFKANDNLFCFNDNSTAHSHFFRSSEKSEENIQNTKQLYQVNLENLARISKNVNIIRTSDLYDEFKKQDTLIHKYNKMLKKDGFIIAPENYITPNHTHWLAHMIKRYRDKIINSKDKIHNISCLGHVREYDFPKFFLSEKKCEKILNFGIDESKPIFKPIGCTLFKPSMWFDVFRYFYRDYLYKYG